MGALIGALIGFVLIALAISFLINTVTMWVVVNFILGKRGDGPFLKCLLCCFYLALVTLAAFICLIIPIPILNIIVGLSVWWKGSLAVIEYVFEGTETGARSILIMYLLTSFAIQWGTRKMLQDSSSFDALEIEEESADESSGDDTGLPTGSTVSFTEESGDSEPGPVPEPAAEPSPIAFPPAGGEPAKAEPANPWTTGSSPSGPTKGEEILKADAAIKAASANWSAADFDGAIKSAETALEIYKRLLPAGDEKISKTEKMIQRAREMKAQPAPN